MLCGRSLLLHRGVEDGNPLHPAFYYLSRLSLYRHCVKLARGYIFQPNGKESVMARILQSVSAHAIIPVGKNRYE